jgi:CRISPR-associated protein Csx17
MRMADILDAVRLPGLRTDMLGNYLAALGVLGACARRWPQARGLWDDSGFVLAAERISRKALCGFILEEWQPTRYERWWKGNKELAKARSWEPDLSRVRLLDAHIIVKRDRKVYNDILGTGGNVGKRDFSKVAERCIDLLKDENASAWLDQALFGEGGTELPDLPSTGTWFASANKAFNSGWSVAREGKLSPWSYLLALEGALMLQGGAGKRLGGRARPYATFPFLSEAAPPETASELGMERSEFWAPVWDRPASLGEVRSLLRRGQARVGCRAARAPYDFAVAAMTAGKQAGVTEFVRFSLRQTTSANTYEAIQSGVAKLAPLNQILGEALVRIADWVNTLPADQANKQKNVYYGLRGSLSRALTRLAQEPEPRRWQDLLFAVAAVQFRVDRNRPWREHARPAPLMPEEILDEAWPHELPKEAQIARSIASVRYGDYKLRHNLFGIDRDRPGAFAEPRPASVVWHDGEPIRALADVMERRLVDAEPTVDGSRAVPPLMAARPCPIEHVDAFLTNRADTQTLADLVPVFSLVAWGKVVPPVEEEFSTASPDLLLQGFFRPLLTPYRLELPGSADAIEPDAIRARTLVRLIRGEMWQQAFEMAEHSYRARGIGIARHAPQIMVSGDRIAASLLIPVTRKAVRTMFRRWINRK